jgi:hypothetical protein
MDIVSFIPELSKTVVFEQHLNNKAVHQAQRCCYVTVLNKGNLI